MLCLYQFITDFVLLGVYISYMHDQPMPDASEMLKRWASFGMNTTRLCEISGLSWNQIGRLFRNGILQKPPYTKKKYYCDYDFFSQIDTESKAYWLGFLYADGCVTDRGGINLLLSPDDIDHLSKYKHSLNAEHPIEKRSDKIQDYRGTRVQHSVKIRISSRQMSDDLIRLGCGPRKTFMIKFPTSDQVPNHLIHHFMRGYFDGDGSIWSTTDKDNNTSYGFTIASTDSFCQSYGELLVLKSGVDIMQLKPHPDSKGISYLVHRRMLNLNRIRDFLYKDATIFLTRKRDKFDTIPLRHYKNDNDMLQSTLKDKIQNEGWTEFSTLMVSALYGWSQYKVWISMREMKEDGMLKIVRTENHRDFYQFV